MAQNLKLFVNYRRADHPEFVETIRTWFLHRYGRENVFMDFDSIPEFARFEDFIRETVRECDALVAIIGPRWIELIREREASGKPDYVRAELEEALQHGKVIAPICIRGADPPPLDQVPESLHPVFDRQFARLRDGKDILDYIEGIMDNLEAELTRQGKQRQVENPPTPEEQAEAAEPVGDFNIHETLEKYFEAFHSGNLTGALIAITRMRESGASIPEAILDLEQAEANLQAHIKLEEEARRRQQVADYLYRMVKIKVRYEPNSDICGTIREIWQIVPGYDPDTIAGHCHEDPVLDILPDPFEWIDIPAGQVTLITKAGWTGNYIPVGEKTFDVAPFTIAKYPVTNAQFQVFVDTVDGYTDARWWDYSDDARKWRQSNARPQGATFGSEGSHPRNATWFEAVAFCLWLSSKANYDVRLPTDQEWQRAAQGDDGRTYPWGNQQPDDQLANFIDNVGQTTPVDRYPAGASPYGVLDMAGNVWEWCVTDYRTGSNNISNVADYRVLRGGSWDDGPGLVRATFRSWYTPSLKWSGSGFRLARSY
jgi:formylglycine-generating enzyme required for sulfatase activity